MKKATKAKPYQALGAALTAARLARGWKRPYVMQRLGWPKSDYTTFARYEDGDRQAPIDFLQKLAALYGMTVEQLTTPAGVENVSRETLLTLPAREFGTAVRQRRESLHMSPKELAKAIGFDPRGKGLEQLEAGVGSAALRARILPKLLDALVTTDDGLLASAAPIADGRLTDYVMELMLDNRAAAKKLEALYQLVTREDA